MYVDQVCYIEQWQPTVGGVPQYRAGCKEVTVSNTIHILCVGDRHDALIQGAFYFGFHIILVLYYRFQTSVITRQYI